MTYLVPADFREATQQPWCKGLLLSENDCSDAELTPLIAQVAGQVEIELGDDFDPPSPDVDETVYMDGTYGSRLYIRRRVRSLTSVSSRSVSGTVTAIPSTSYRLHSSLNATGTAMANIRDKRDWIDSVSWNTWAYEIQLVGKFGWAAVPSDIKRLVAIRAYEIVRSTTDPTSRILQKTTVDSTVTYADDSLEAQRLMDIYGRKMPVTA